MGLMLRCQQGERITELLCTRVLKLSKSNSKKNPSNTITTFKTKKNEFNTFIVTLHQQVMAKVALTIFQPITWLETIKHNLPHYELSSWSLSDGMWTICGLYGPCTTWGLSMYHGHPAEASCTRSKNSSLSGPVAWRWIICHTHRYCVHGGEWVSRV